MNAPTPALDPGPLKAEGMKDSRGQLIGIEVGDTPSSASAPISQGQREQEDATPAFQIAPIERRLYPGTGRLYTQDEFYAFCYARATGSEDEALRAFTEGPNDALRRAAQKMWEQMLPGRPTFII